MTDEEKLEKIINRNMRKPGEPIGIPKLIEIAESIIRERISNSNQNL